MIAAAGLATPAVDAMLWTGSRDEDVGHEMMAAILRSLSPLAERVGLAGEIDPDLATLPDRLRAAVRTEGTLIGPLVCGVAARRA